MSDTTQQDANTTDQQTFLQKLGVSATVLFLILWGLAGVAAIIMSIVCFGFSGSLTEKIVGLAIAFFLGPLYFIFYGVNKPYCRSLGANVSGSVSRMMGGALSAAAASE